ncbi:hypothetical protein OUZ56_025463 [Daphnia magna]|uniref:Secreted protein n=1 Tax=Daphnia magna TaxID=35525 RepID=A0ABQ9ZJX6_9CRUS|nr:hypothetical protein OUZ56_025463 [Daphnia magna]
MPYLTRRIWLLPLPVSVCLVDVLPQLRIYFTELLQRSTIPPGLLHCSSLPLGLSSNVVNHPTPSLLRGLRPLVALRIYAAPSGVFFSLPHSAFRLNLQLTAVGLVPPCV